MQGLRAIFQMLLSNTVLRIPTSEARRATLTRAVMLTRLLGHTGQCVLSPRAGTSFLPWKEAWK